MLKLIYFTLIVNLSLASPIPKTNDEFTDLACSLGLDDCTSQEREGAINGVLGNLLNQKEITATKEEKENIDLQLNIKNEETVETTKGKGKGKDKGKGTSKGTSKGKGSKGAQTRS
ncbi:hypothetical protein CONCODRAFT_74076 [Conidiobolus coronatus NRRL 28638]|uniref:Secreted protein n=1 Tax=Conidiobolus coronatus (strain ATCC 28846 / CBS 209.66 / NRRL 28638) TaxID=796925 RepID=A0A137NSS6_CONC2|nr:hypothetical protein CONCODRAFT_74076 [Conidiobolus coronatus NRRL 28638]|eukprot:KXN65833.1 hypothetical protein CONCODRAFT_74076 [Conidiobolus coronatus NRRL 28638]